MAGDDNSRSIWPDLAAGLVTGISIVLWCFTLAALIFEGDLAPFMARGAGFILLGAAMLALTVALTNSYPATISAPCEAAGVIVGLVASAIAASATMDGESKFATVMAVIVVSSLLSGFVFAALGALKLGDAVRFIPHPVIGGVVVTMGWLLVSGAFAVMTDFELAAHSLPRLFTAASVPAWAPGTLMAVVLLAASRRWQHALALPCLLIAANGVYYAIAVALGGFILFFGLVLLHEWVVEGWRRLPRADYVVVILCLVVSIWAGYLAGVGAGIVAGVMIFVFNYSRIDVISTRSPAPISTAMWSAIDWRASPSTSRATAYSSSSCRGSSFSARHIASTRRYGSDSTMPIALRSHSCCWTSGPSPAWTPRPRRASRR